MSVINLNSDVKSVLGQYLEFPQLIGLAKLDKEFQGIVARHLKYLSPEQIDEVYSKEDFLKRLKEIRDKGENYTTLVEQSHRGGFFKINYVTNESTSTCKKLHVLLSGGESVFNESGERQNRNFEHYKDGNLSVRFRFQSWTPIDKNFAREVSEILEQEPVSSSKCLIL